MKKIILAAISVFIIQHSFLWANPPQWSLDASQYEFSMTITSLVYMDNALANNPDNILAAWVDEEIRGVALPVYDSYNGRYLFFLTIFSNQFTGEDVTFRFYDATSASIADLWNEITFTSASNQGSIANPYLFFSEQPGEPSTVSFIVEDENGIPLIDATVTFNGQVLDPGTFTVENVYPGTYEWTVEKEGYISQSADLTIVAGVPLVTVNVVLANLPPDPVFYTLQFTVLSPNGVPLTNVNINFRGEEFEDQLVFTDIEPGTYPYQISSDGYISMAGHVTVISANVQVQVTLQYLVEDPDPDTFSIVFTVSDVEGNPLDGVTIILNDEVYTDQLVFSDLGQGAHNYTVSSDGYISKSGQINLINANVHVQVTLQLLPVDPDPEYFTVLFTVSDTQGEPLEGIVIVFDGESNVDVFLYIGLEQGVYDYEIQKDGYISKSGQITIVSSDVNLQVTLLQQPVDPDPETFELHFSVLDLNGNSIQDVEILLNGMTFVNQLVFTELASGTYDYQIKKTGYLSRDGQIIITSSNVYIDIVMLEQPTNTIDQNAIDLRIYPNPASNFVRIDSKHEAMIAAIEMYDTSGKQVMYAEGFHFGDRIDISPLVKGIYLFTIVLENGSKIVEKLIIN